MNSFQRVARAVGYVIGAVVLVLFAAIVIGGLAWVAVTIWGEVL